MHIPRYLYLYTLAIWALVACDSNKKISTNAAAADTLQQSTRGKGTSPEENIDLSEGSLGTPSDNMEQRARDGFEKAAKAFMDCYREARFAEFVQYMHPTVVKVYGGDLAFIDQLKKSKAQDKQRYRKWESGPLEAFTAVRDPKGLVTGYYCVVPIKRWLEGSSESEYQLQWLGGQSLDGEKFHFVDITDGDKGMIYRIMPDMRYLLENLGDEEVPEG